MTIRFILFPTTKPKGSEMYTKICSICNNPIYSESEYFYVSSSCHKHCKEKKKSRDRTKKNLMRTSTPVAELEHNPKSEIDLFYESWKSGLHSDDTVPDQRLCSQWSHQPLVLEQQVLCANQVVYVYTAFYQPFQMTSYFPQVGFRPDGTFGVLPPYWNYNNNPVFF